jgi:hypothetical protein
VGARPCRGGRRRWTRFRGWRGPAGAESAELAWLDGLSLRPRPGRRLPLGRSRVLLAGVGVIDGPAGELAAATVSVVDLAAGRVLAQWRGRMPELVDGCCEGPVG